MNLNTIYPLPLVGKANNKKHYYHTQKKKKKKKPKKKKSGKRIEIHSFAFQIGWLWYILDSKDLNSWLIIYQNPKNKIK